jgi:hypothetical protein
MAGRVSAAIRSILAIKDDCSGLVSRRRGLFLQGDWWNGGYGNLKGALLSVAANRLLLVCAGKWRTRHAMTLRGRTF